LVCIDQTCGAPLLGDWSSCIEIGANPNLTCETHCQNQGSACAPLGCGGWTTASADTLDSCDGEFFSEYHEADCNTPLTTIYDVLVPGQAASCCCQ
jgi:hypothetical protein